MSYRVIQVSEISDYVFCRRSWWLRRMAGRVPANVHELSAGSQHHRAHGSAVQRTASLQRAALLLLFLAVSTFVFWLISVL